MPMVPNSEAEILNILKLPYDMQGNGCFSTVSQLAYGRKTVVEGLEYFAQRL